MALPDNKQWNTKGHSRCAFSKAGSCHSCSFLTYIFFPIIPFKYKTGILWKRSVLKKLWHPGENYYCYNSSLFISSFSLSMCVSFVGVWVYIVPLLMQTSLWISILSFTKLIPVFIFYVRYKSLIFFLHEQSLRFALSPNAGKVVLTPLTELLSCNFVMYIISIKVKRQIRSFKA